MFVKLKLFLINFLNRMLWNYIDRYEWTSREAYYLAVASHIRRKTADILETDFLTVRSDASAAREPGKPRAPLLRGR